VSFEELTPSAVRKSLLSAGRPRQSSRRLRARLGNLGAEAEGRCQANGLTRPYKASQRLVGPYGGHIIPLEGAIKPFTALWGPIRPYKAI